MEESFNITYGFIDEFSESIINELESLTNLKLEPHNSSYWGDYWLYENDSFDREFKVYLNQDPTHDPTNDPKDEFYFDSLNKDCETLLSVDGESEWVKEIDDAIAGMSNIKKLKSELYEHK